MAQRSRDKAADDSSNAVFLVLLIVAAVGAGLPAILAAALLVAWMRRAAPGDNERLISVAVLAVLGVGIALLLRDQYPEILPQLKRMLRSPRTADWWEYLRWVWAITLPFAPALAIGLDFFLPKRAETRLDEQQHAEGARVQRAVRGAQKVALQAPEAVQRKDGEAALVLGALISGDLHDRQEGNLHTFPEAELRKHVVAVGASGSGKSETLLRIAALAAKVYGWQVIYIDAKGEPRTAARFLSAMKDVGLTNVAYFPTRAYDGWRGDGRALLNRFHEVLDYTEPYYDDTTANALGFAIDAPLGLPQAGAELVERLNKHRLRELYKGHPDAPKIERLTAKGIEGAHERFSSFFRTLGTQLDGAWALDDVEAAYFLINGTAYKREAAKFGRYMLEEVAHYVTERKPLDRPVLLIVDEFSAISATADATNLFERLRSFNAAVIVSSQTAAGLGAAIDRLLGAATTTIVHSCADPDKLIKLAGTVQRYDYNYQTEDGGPTGKGTIRTREAARVDPNAVRQLAVGEAFVIAHGKAARIQVSPIEADEDRGQLYMRQGGFRPWGVRTISAAELLARRNAPALLATAAPQAPAQATPPPQAARVAPLETPVLPLVTAGPTNQGTDEKDDLNADHASPTQPPPHPGTDDEPQLQF